MQCCKLPLVTLSWWLALLSSIEIRIFHFAASPDTCTWITFTTAARWELSLALPSKLTTISEPSIAFLDIFATLSRCQDTSCPHLVEFLGRKCSDSLALLNNSCFAKHSTQDHSTIRSCDGCAKNLGRDNFLFPSISILLVLARVRHHTSEESDQIANSVPPKLIEFLWSIAEHSSLNRVSRRNQSELPRNPEIEADSMNMIVVSCSSLVYCSLACLHFANTIMATTSNLWYSIYGNTVMRLVRLMKISTFTPRWYFGRSSGYNDVTGKSAGGGEGVRGGKGGEGWGENSPGEHAPGPPYPPAPLPLALSNENRATSVTSLNNNA